MRASFAIAVVAWMLALASRGALVARTRVTSFAKKVWGWITHPVKTVKTVFKTVTNWVMQPVTTWRKVTSWVTKTVHRVWHTVEHATRTVLHTTYRTVQRFKTVTEKVTRKVAPRVWRGLQQLPGKATTWVVAKAKHMVDVSIALFDRFAGNNRITELLSMLT